MAKSVKFKSPNSLLHVKGFGVIDNSNLTLEKYEYLLKLSPAHADQFIVSEAEEKQLPKPKPVKE